MKHIFITALVIFFLNINGNFIHAQDQQPTAQLEFNQQPTAQLEFNQQPITGCTGNGVCIENPLRAQSITAFFLDIIQILLIFAIPIIVFFIILAGFRFVTAQGNETQIGEAKRALLYAIIGGLLILGAFVILEVIQGTVASFQANPR